MKVLSLTQPWATLVILGEKRFETRSWRLHYRGELAIHASKEFPGWAKALCKTCIFAEVLEKHNLTVEDLPLASILGTVQAKDCYATEIRRSSLDEQELEFGNYDNGRFCFELTNPTPFKTPIPAKGALGLWNWEPEYIPNPGGVLQDSEGQRPGIDSPAHQNPGRGSLIPPPPAPDSENGEPQTENPSAPTPSEVSP